MTGEFFESSTALPAADNGEVKWVPSSAQEARRLSRLEPSAEWLGGAP